MSSTHAGQPSERAATLAAQFDALHAEVVALVRACPPERWQQATESEGWPLAVVAHHIARAYGFHTVWILAVARGESVTTSMDDIHAANVDGLAVAARHPESYTQEAVLALLERNGQEASRVVRALSDQELRTSAPFAPADRPLTTEQVVKYALIAHVRDHLASMRASLDAAQG